MRRFHTHTHNGKEHRLLAFEEAKRLPAAEKAGKKAEDAKEKAASPPITVDRVRSSYDMAMEKLEYLEENEQKSVAKAFGAMLKGLGDKYKSLEETDKEKRQQLLEQIYSQCQDILKTATKAEFERCRNLEKPTFTKEGIDCTVKGKKMQLGTTEDFAIRTLQIDGATVSYDPPISLKRFDENFALAAIATLGKIRERVKSVDGLKIKATGARFEWTAKQAGKEVRYVATADDVLEVKQVPTEAKKKELIGACRKRAELMKKLEMPLRTVFKTQGKNALRDIEMRLYSSDETEILGFDTSKFTAKQKEEWTALRGTLKDLAKANGDIQELREACNTRMLEGKDTAGKPVVVREVNLPDLTNDFQWTYLGADKQPVANIIVRDDGSPLIRTKQELEKGKVVRQTKYTDSDDSHMAFDLQKGVAEQTEKGKKLFRVTFDPKNPGVILTTDMYDGRGGTISTLDRERKKQPEMTEDQYLDLLAKKLDTPQKLGLFIELFLQYAHDSDDPKNPLKKGTKEKSGDYWQTAQETVRRLENGKMLGDCEDWAFLAKEILRRQGKSVVVLDLRTHAECVWAEKRPDGRWDAYSVGTFGLDYNGYRGTAVDTPIAKKGHATLREALDSLMKKYQRGGLGAEDGMNVRLGKDAIEIMRIPKTGVRETDTVPLLAFEQSKMGRDYLAASELESRVDRYEKAEKKYLELAKEYPREPAFLERLAFIYRYRRSLNWSKKMEALDKKDTKGGWDNRSDGMVKIPPGKEDAQLVAVYEQLIKLKPEEPRLYVELGNLYAGYIPQRSMQYYQLALQKGSTDQMALSALQELASKQGAAGEKALQPIYKRFIARTEKSLDGKTARDDIEALDFLQTLYRAAGQTEKITPSMVKAIARQKEEWKAALARGDDTEPIKVRLRVTCMKLAFRYEGLRKFEEGIKLCKEIRDLLGGDKAIEGALKQIEKSAANPAAEGSTGEIAGTRPDGLPSGGPDGVIPPP